MAFNQEKGTSRYYLSKAWDQFFTTDNMAFYASAGHGFSLPSPEETLLPEGAVNPDIKPEQGFQYEIGSRFNLVNRVLEVDAALYLIELKTFL